jgi:hypothetical protein
VKRIYPSLLFVLFLFLFSAVTPSNEVCKLSDNDFIALVVGVNIKMEDGDGLSTSVILRKESGEEFSVRTKHSEIPLIGNSVFCSNSLMASYPSCIYSSKLKCYSLSEDNGEVKGD